jgi:integrase
MLIYLKASVKEKGEVLASYSFRHRFAHAADEAGFNDRMNSKLMGHSRETFVKLYGDKARDEELLAAAERLLGNQQVPAFV